MADKIETYFLDDKASAYHGRKVETVRHLAGIGRIVRVSGTNIEITTSLRYLAATEAGIIEPRLI